MKRLFQPLLLVLSLFLVMPVQGQFLKKLSKKISKNAERKLEQKIEKKSDEKIEKSLDGIFEAPGKLFKDAEEPSSSYNFSYHYQLEVKVEGVEESHKMNYYLEPEANYMGMEMNQDENKIFMVMDQNKKAIYNFMDSGGGKTMIPIALNPEDIFSEEDENMDAEENVPDYKITDLPSKTILGYHAKGKQLEDEDWKIKIYYTEDVPITMADIFSFNTKENEQQNTDVFNEGMEGLPKALMLEMEGINKKDKSQHTHFVCTKLDKTNRSLNSSDYKSMF